MAATATMETPNRIAVVTGANRGIGLEICRQLASSGVMVVLTARDEKKGSKAAQSLRNTGLSTIAFHQLDVTDPASMASLSDYIKNQFGKLDILVNNAGIIGLTIDAEGFARLDLKTGEEILKTKDPLLKKIMVETQETAELCLKTNYYGVKMLTEALIPLLQLSSSPKIVNISSRAGLIESVSNEWAKEVLSNVDGLTEEKVDEVVNGFRQDAKQDLLEKKGWPFVLSAYIISKAALNAYTRILARKLPNFCVNAVTPGFVKTDMSCNMGKFSVEEGARGPVKLALAPAGGPSGQFFFQSELSHF